MANVLNRTTFQFLRSVNTPEFDSVDWVINPDMTPVAGVSDKYWKLTGDVLSEMNQTEKDAVDAAETAQANEALVLSDYLGSGQSMFDFRSVDYKTGLTSRLHKVITTMYRGELREVNYFTDSTETTLVLSVKVFADESLTTPGYSRNTLGQPLERWTERTWYKKTGEAHTDKKVTHKVYFHDPIAQMKEGLRRRQNQIDKLSVDILKAYIGTEAVDPMNPTQAELDTAYDVVTSYNDKYEGPLTTFIRVGRNDFLTSPASPNVTDDTETWLDNSVTPLGYPAGWTIRTIITDSVKNIVE